MRRMWLWREILRQQVRSDADDENDWGAVTSDAEVDDDDDDDDDAAAPGSASTAAAALRTIRAYLKLTLP